MKRINGNLAGLSAAGVGVLLATAAVPAAAADSDANVRIKELERKLERSIQMIEALQGEVATLKARAVPAAAPAPAPTTVVAEQQAAKIEALEQQVAQLGSGISRRSTLEDGVPLHGFMDVGLRHSGEDNALYGRGKKGFNLGSFDVYLTPQFGSNVRSLVELNFEIDNDGGVAVDLERLQLGYAFGDYLTAWGGRFHTPYGYWNTAFHHGAQIQTAISRPRFLDFEDKGGILPAHMVGAWGTGAANLSAGKLGYDAYLGNAQGISDAGTQGTGTLDMKMAGSDRQRAMGGANLWFSPRAMSDLRIGVHGMHGTIQDDAAISHLTRVNMLGGYGAFIDDNWEIMAEYYNFDDRNLEGGTGSHRSNAWYAQLGYNFGGITPYGRYERTSLNQGDNYFSQQANGRSYRRGVAGLRYDLDPKSALKLELGRTTKRDLTDAGTGISVPNDSFSEVMFQYSARF